MINDLIKEGMQTKIDKHAELEKTKLGILRGGSTGMMTESGRIIGQCAGKAYLRMIGCPGGEPTDINKQLMFDGGLSNEDIWLDHLKTSWLNQDRLNNILCEEEVPTRWMTDSGIPVTGRPDIVLARGTGPDLELIRGIELKQCMSVNSSYGVLISNEPQLKHVMQAAHYMNELGCTFELWYTNRMNFDCPDWMNFRPFPSPDSGIFGADSLGYKYFELGNINPRTNRPVKHARTYKDYIKNNKVKYTVNKIKPFLKGFILDIRDDGQVYLKHSEPELFWSGDKRGDEWMKTIVNINDIKRFYNYVSELTPTDIVPRPADNLGVFGKKIGWRFDEYSDLKELDVYHQYKTKTSIGEWEREVRKQFTT